MQKDKKITFSSVFLLKIGKLQLCAYAMKEDTLNLASCNLHEWHDVTKNKTQQFNYLLRRT